MAFSRFFTPERFSWFHDFRDFRDFRGFRGFHDFRGFFRDSHVFVIFMFCVRCEYEKGLETHHSHEGRTGEFLLLARPHRAASVC